MKDSTADRGAALTRVSLRRVLHHTDAAGRSGWILAGANRSNASDWMVMADFADGSVRRIVHDGYRTSRVVAGYVLEMYGVAYRFPGSVEEWSYDVECGVLSCDELEAV